MIIIYQCDFILYFYVCKNRFIAEYFTLTLCIYYVHIIIIIKIISIFL